MISNLRILGILLGLCGIIGTLYYYRGVKWRRNSVILMVSASTLLLSVSANPDLADTIRDILLFKEVEFGRILALLLISAIFSLFFVFYLYGKMEKIKHENDLLFRSVSLLEVEQRTNIKKQLKPITIIIPAFNEADNLRILLPQIPKQLCGMEVSTLVVDDGSTDATLQVLEELGALYIRNIVNRGQGAASRLGYSLLKSSDVRVGIAMDADNQHRPEDLPQFIQPILEDGYDLVIGSRRLGSEHSASTLRGFGVPFFSKILSLSLGVTLTDASSGFKAFSRRWLETVNLAEDQFQSTEVLITTIKSGLKVGEVPITIMTRAHGKSKKGTDILYGVKVAKVLLKTWWKK